MDASPRKQRERRQREELIMDTAQTILNQEGFASLTMERIAADIEYSKGTVYNHFSSKEEIISAISCRCMQTLAELFSRAARYPGKHRERISAVIIAHSLYAQLHPVEIQNMQLIKSRVIRDRISIQKQNEILALERKVTSIALNIVSDAIKAGDIPSNYSDDEDSIVFGLWTMGYGSNLLHLSDIPFDKLDMRPPLDIAWINSNKLLDSYDWKPLSTEMDIYSIRQKLMNDLFSEEFTQLKIAQG